MVKGVIILDGPDGCGKTTLANRLIAEHGGTYIHLTYRFKNKMPLYHAAMLRKAMRLAKTQLVIIDRLHISEYIYAKVFRGGTKWPWMIGCFNDICKAHNIPIVLCLPDTIEQGVSWFNKAKDERPEMYDDMTQVVSEYLDFSKTIEHSTDFIRYNKDWSDERKRLITYRELEKRLEKNEK